MQSALELASVLLACDKEEDEDVPASSVAALVIVALLELMGSGVT